jgi:hypothetical protein
MLGSVLGKLRKFGVHYYGELFAAISIEPQIGAIMGRYWGLLPKYVVSFFRQKNDWRPFALEEPGADIQRILSVLKSLPGIHIIKVFPSHLQPETLELVLSQFTHSVIFVRRNHLQRYVSLQRAKLSGEWTTTKYENLEITVDDSEFVKFQQGAVDWYSDTKEKITQLGLDIIDVDYEEILSVEGLRTTISRALKIPAELLTDDILQPSTEKQSIHGIRRREFDFKEIVF